MIRIETERLITRQFEGNDASDLLEYLSRPCVNCFLSEKLNSLEETVEDIKRRTDDELELAVCLKENNKVVGNLFAKKEDLDTYNIGWQYNEIVEGNGYGSQAAKAYLTYLFSKKARRIYAYAEETNQRSQKLCERLGIRKEGCFNEFISFTQNQKGMSIYEDTLQYSI